MYLEKQTAIICGVSVLSAFIIGILIGTFAINNNNSDDTIEDDFENKEFVADNIFLRICRYHRCEFNLSLSSGQFIKSFKKSNFVHF